MLLQHGGKRGPAVNIGQEFAVEREAGCAAHAELFAVRIAVTDADGEPTANQAEVTTAEVAEGLQVLADELESLSSVRVNSLNPGATWTRMRQAAFPGEDPATLRSAEEIMPTYLWLMGDDSQGHTGERFDAQPARN